MIILFKIAVWLCLLMFVLSVLGVGYIILSVLGVGHIIWKFFKKYMKS